MATEVILPMLGETMNEGTIVAWAKQEGDPVRPGDVLYSVESDKATLDVEAQASGFLRRILAPAGATVPVLSAVALITATMDESVSGIAAAASPAAATPSPSRAPTHATLASAPLPAGRPFASPRARKAALARGLDLRRIRGSGPGGRIVERDLAGGVQALTPLARKAAEALRVDPAAVHGTGPGGRVTRQDVERLAAAPEAGVQPLSRSQRLMAERMVTSFTTAPHFYLHVEVSARRLLAVRQDLLPSLEASAGVHLTLTDLLVKLCALALARHPRALAQWSADGLRPARGVNIGIATDTPGGLLVPVIQDADRIGLVELTRRRTELVDRARAGKSLPQDFELGAFTLTNLGMFRVDSFDAILNPPQAAILAVGRIKDRATVVEGRLQAEPMMNLSLSVDHRVLDGAGAARFLDDLVGMIETPSLALA